MQRSIDDLLAIRRNLGINVIPYGHRGYDPAKEVILPYGYRAYDPTREFVVPQEQGIYDPSVFGVYDLKSQRVVSKEQHPKPDLGNFDLLVREAQRFARVAPVKAESDRYVQVLSVLSSLGAGSGICLDACTGSPLEGARKTVTALGYQYLPIDLYGDGKTVRKEDVTKLSFATGSISRIISLDTLEHIEDYTKAIAEFYRVLIEDGFAIFHVPCYYFEKPQSVPIEDPRKDPWGHVRYFSAKELIKSLAEVGFIILRVGFQFDYGAIWCLTAKNTEITFGEKGR